MKKLSVLLGAALMMVVAACETETVELGGEIQHFSYETTDAELNRLLMAEFGHTDLSLDEKMDFLSDYLVADLMPAEATTKGDLAGREPDIIDGPGSDYPIGGGGTSSHPDDITCVAQVYDADFGTYFTEVDAGTVNDYLSARVKRQREGSFGFVGTNANVYRNGVNIKGAIDSESNFSCSGTDVKAVADCDWSSYSQQAFAYVYIKCDD